MEIIADQLSKRYRSHWVFRSMSFTIGSGQRIGITGPNGSGKSTLLKVLSGALPASEGTLQYQANNGEIGISDIFRHVIMAAPYIDLIDEMTIAESLTFHQRFRAFKRQISVNEFVELLGPRFKQATAIKDMSSGMKQRMRLALALCSRTSILLLDEPTTNLDEEGIAWFHRMLQEWTTNETVLIASNVQSDMSACTRFIHLPDYSLGQ